MRAWFMGAALMVAGPSWAGPLKVTWKVLHIEEGYDHPSKLQVEVNGNVVGVSEVSLQSEGGTFRVDVPREDFELRIVLLTEYEGRWEEHTVANQYSIDCELLEMMKARKKHKRSLVFDLDAGFGATGS